MSPASSVNAGRWVAISRVWVAAGCGSVPPVPATGSSAAYPLRSVPCGGGALVPTSANAVNVNGAGTGPPAPAERRAGAVVKCASPVTVPSDSRSR